MTLAEVSVSLCGGSGVRSIVRRCIATAGIAEVDARHDLVDHAISHYPTLAFTSTEDSKPASTNEGLGVIRILETRRPTEAIAVKRIAFNSPGNHWQVMGPTDGK